MANNITPPRSQNPSPLPPVLSTEATQPCQDLPNIPTGYMNSGRFSNMEFSDRYQTGLEPPTPSDTPNKSFDLSEYDDDNGSSMLLASLMEDISSLSTVVAEGQSRGAHPGSSQQPTNNPFGVYHRRHSLPTSLIGFEDGTGSCNDLRLIRSSNHGSENFNGNARLSRIPEFGGGGGAEAFRAGAGSDRAVASVSSVGASNRHCFAQSLSTPSVIGAGPWSGASASGGYSLAANRSPALSGGGRFSAAFQPSQSDPSFAHSLSAYQPQQQGKQHIFPAQRQILGDGPGNLICYLVQFTCGRTDTFYVPHGITLSISIGDYVIVEADRGEDLGRVIMNNINVPLPRRNSSSAALPPFSNNISGPAASSGTEMFIENAGVLISEEFSQMAAPVSNLPKKIYRIATAVEVESLLGKVRDEINAITVGQFKVQEWKLPMAIIDAEYQWDRRKLTFFFSVTLPQFYPNQPAPRIDFRTLVRDLYQIYRTRIWMFCVDKDKNRSCRSHNREKFIKQLNEDLIMTSETPDLSSEFSRLSSSSSVPFKEEKNSGGGEEQHEVDENSGQNNEWASINLLGSNIHNYKTSSVDRFVYSVDGTSIEGLQGWTKVANNNTSDCQFLPTANYTEFGVTQL